VFISSVIAEKYGLGPGDRLLVKTRLGETPFTVTAVTVDYSNQGLVIDGSWRDMEHYFRLRGANTPLVKVTPGATPDGVGDEIDARYGERERLVIMSNETLLGRITTLMQQVFRMFDVLALIAMLVGLYGYYQYAHDECHGTHPRDWHAARGGHDTRPGGADGIVWSSADGPYWWSDGTSFWRGPLAPFPERYDQHVGLPTDLRSAAGEYFGGSVDCFPDLATGGFPTHFARLTYSHFGSHPIQVRQRTQMSTDAPPVVADFCSRSL
jgi:hypothetical protein